MIILSLLAWLGFAVSAAIHLTSWAHSTPCPEAAMFFMQFACIVLMLVVTGLKGGFKRQLDTSDCGGPARPLLTLFIPYFLLLFVFQMLGHHDKPETIWKGVQLFSSLWMAMYLYTAGLLAGPRR